VLPLLTTEKYLFPSLLKKILQNRAAFFHEHTGRDLKIMVEPAIPTDPVTGNHTAALGINRSENQPLYPGMNHGRSAHGTGLKGHIEHSSRQTIIIKKTSAKAKRPDFGMSCRITVSPNIVSRPGDDLTITNKNSADRHLSKRCRCLCLRKGQLHHLLVIPAGYHNDSFSHFIVRQEISVPPKRLILIKNAYPLSISLKKTYNYEKDIVMTYSKHTKKLYKIL
jgi:hypothetical protein